MGPNVKPISKVFHLVSYHLCVTDSRYAIWCGYKFQSGKVLCEVILKEETYGE